VVAQSPENFDSLVGDCWNFGRLDFSGGFAAVQGDLRDCPAVTRW
jgi:hypothetical protein